MEVICFLIAVTIEMSVNFSYEKPLLQKEKRECGLYKNYNCIYRKKFLNLARDKKMGKQNIINKLGKKRYFAFATNGENIKIFQI